MTDTAQPAAAQHAVASNDIRDNTELPVPAAAPPPSLPDGLSDGTGKRTQANRRDTADEIVARGARYRLQAQSIGPKAHPRRHT